MCESSVLTYFFAIYLRCGLPRHGAVTRRAANLKAREDEAARLQAALPPLSERNYSKGALPYMAFAASLACRHRFTRCLCREYL